MSLFTRSIVSPPTVIEKNKTNGPTAISGTLRCSGGHFEFIDKRRETFE